MSSNKFDILCDDEEEKEVPAVIPRKECWADIAAKPKPIEDKFSQGFVVLTPNKTVTKKESSFDRKKELYRRNWADWSDSDDDEDDDDLSQQPLHGKETDEDW